MNDRDLGIDRPSTRRDFLNGAAIGIGGALAAGGLPADLLGFARMLDDAGFAQDAPGYYPPAQTGMRGSHDGSFDVAHALRDGSFFRTATRPIASGESYDLVVVGGGISGLAAAYFYRSKQPDARILILDNHDDFGGHAKRNEFRPGGRLWIANGGTQSIESPFPYSAEARALMQTLGIEPPRLAEQASQAADRSVFSGLQGSYFFDKETFGVDRLVVGSPGGGRGRGRGGSAGLTWPDFLAKTPLTPQVQKDIARLETANVDYMPGLSNDAKKDALSR